MYCKYENFMIKFIKTKRSIFMFGNVLRDLRRQKNLTQQELSKTLEVSAPTIALWETNKREPDMQMLRNIADYFDVSINYLFEYGKENANQTIAYANNYLTEENRLVLDMLHRLNGTNRLKAVAYISGLLAGQ